MKNDKQFVLGQKVYEHPDWYHVTLPNRYILSYHKDLPVYFNDRKDLILIGRAWQVDPNRCCPTDEINRLTAETTAVSQAQIIDMEKTWCGRYIIISHDTIYLDAGALLNVFHSDEYVTSSLNILCTLEKRKMRYPKICHHVNPDFIFGTHTPYPGVKRVLPSQIYHYTTHSTENRKIIPDGILSYSSDQERAEAFSHYFVHFLQNLAQSSPHQTLMLALTGGHDSRITMAMLEKSGVNYDIFSFAHPRISHEDRETPVKLSGLCHRKFHFIPRNPADFSADRYNDYREHTAGLTIDEDLKMYAHNQFETLRKEIGTDLILIRGAIWEDVIEYYKPKSADFNLLDFYPLIQYDPEALAFACEWKANALNDPLNQDFGINNRLYLDLRVGCWVSAIEHGFDMMEGITSVQGFNCRLFKSILLGFDKAMRQDKKHQEYITQLVCPVLGTVPYDTDNYGTAGKKQIAIRFLQSLNGTRKVYGLKHTVCHVLSRCKKFTKRFS